MCQFTCTFDLNDEMGPLLLRGIADLMEAAKGDQKEATPSPVTPGSLRVGENTWDVDQLRRNILGGVSPVWRPMLQYLAAHRDEWVPWPEICKVLQRTPAQMAGALGAAERRCVPPLPYDKNPAGGHKFRMHKEVAQVVDEVLAGALSL